VKPVGKEERYMDRLFDVVAVSKGEEKGGPRLGIRCIFMGEANVCPVSAPCASVEELETEARKLKDDLDRAVDRARRILAGGPEEEAAPLSSDISVADLWRALESMPDDAGFVERFNGLGEDRRREVAEHVLTSCNIFSGRPAFFSSRYDADTAFLAE